MWVKHEGIEQKLVGKRIQKVEINVIRNVLYDVALVLDDGTQIEFPLPPPLTLSTTNKTKLSAFGKRRKETKMASGILKVPAPHLPGVIKTVRAGLKYLIMMDEMKFTDVVYINLTKWCEDMEAYLVMLKDKDNGQHTQ